nr:hemerythrin domain-containing protein [Propionicimonas sp.]
MCSYCGCDSIEVIGRFMAEHVEIINATGELRAAVHSNEPDAVAAARTVVASLLWPHTTAEEAGLFRVMAQDEVYADHIAGLCAEHESLDLLLAAITPGDAGAMARFEDALREHIDKEDNGLFPAAAIALDGPQWVEVHETTPHTADHSHDHDHPHDHSHDHPGTDGSPHPSEAPGGAGRDAVPSR